MIFVLSFASVSLAERNFEEGLVSVSGPASPSVAYGVRRDADSLTLTVSVASITPAGGDVSLQVGLATENKSLVLKDSDAHLTRRDGTNVFDFQVPAAKLVDAESDWEHLRLGLAVSWAGGPNGLPRQRESFLQSGTRATHEGLSTDPHDWKPISLVEFERSAKDRALEIAFRWDQPSAGKGTIVIDDEQGRRVRNLISGRSMEAGAHRIVWDGRDDDGRMMPPGKYRWRGISHPGLTANYLFSYADGPGSNHGTFHAAATNGTSLFFGTSVAEGGFEIVQLAPDGTFQRGFNAPNGHGLGRVALAADEKYLYAAYDGTSWGQHVDRSKPDWKAEQQITIVRFELKTGKVSDFSPTSRAVKIREYVVGPGSPGKLPDGLALAGMTLFKGRLFLADGIANEMLVVDPEKGDVIRSFALKEPAAIAAGAGTLYAITAGALVQLDETSGESKTIAPITGRPGGLSIGNDGTFYVSDAKENVVRVLNAQGRQMAIVGKAGGVTPGPYDPLQFHNPAGLVMSPDGHLWVTENQRWRPKRLAAFDPRANTMWKEYFGPTAYGAPGLAFDPDDATQWIGQDTLFKLDFAAKSAKPLAILGGEDAAHYRYWRQEGRTFLISYGKATYIQELLPNKTLKPLACLSSAHQFSYRSDWKPLQAFVDAFHRDYPNVKYEIGHEGQPSHGYGMLWVDRNGDSEMQSDEIEFSTAAESLAGSGWGHDFNDLTLHVPAKVNGKPSMVTLKPSGFYPGGAPRYPALNDAVKAAVPIDLPEQSVMAETTVDGFGNMMVNSDPRMTAFAPDGRLLWSYPNRWSNVHGSHDAPLPTLGELQGVLFFTGVAPFDDRADVMLMNGNHGRAFVMTTDGLYLDEMFSDVRLMNNPQASGVDILGGECFGGAFGRSNKDGAYYFQGGGNEYRIYRVDGIDKAKRAGGSIEVSPAQAIAAERNAARTLAAIAKPRRAEVPFHAKPLTPATADAPVEPTLRWDRDGKFPVSVNASHDGKTLFLQYIVRGDASPWVNNGKDWQQLFKTGDGVDLQLGTDPGANAARSSPVPGDLRLFVAPFEGKSIAVLYRHRLPGATDSVIFQSPWRSEKVDSVRKLDSAKIEVKRDGDNYSIGVSVPLVDLGLDPIPAAPLRADFGVIYGNPEGTVNLFRNYWSNRSTGLVNDVPGEIMLTPNLWGDVTFAKGGAMKRSLRTMCGVVALACSALSLHAGETLRCTGVLGNSGEQGGTLVRFGEKSASGIGIVYDRYGSLWDRGGAGVLNRYALDGRLLASYPLPNENPTRYNDAITSIGDNLMLRLGSGLYTLPIEAPAGTTPKKLDIEAEWMSPSSWDWWVCAATHKGEIFLVKPDGARRPVATLKASPFWLELGPDGAVYFRDNEQFMRIASNETTPKPIGSTPGDTPQFLAGAWYGHAGHSTIRRFSDALRPDPGVVLGGNSGSFIGHVDEQAEIDVGHGLAQINPELFAVSGATGVDHLLHWSAADRRMTPVRRIGAVRECSALGLDRDGRVWYGFGSWEWNDGPATPLHFGVPPGEAYAATMLDSDAMIAFGKVYGKAGFYYGKLSAEVKHLRVEEQNALPEKAVAIVPLQHKGRNAILILGEDGRGTGAYIAADGRYEQDTGVIEIKTDKPVNRWRSLVSLSADHLIGAADGFVIELNRDGDGWRETARWNSWGGAPAEKFGKTIVLTADAGRLWISDSERYRVVCFDAAGKKPLASFGTVDVSGDTLSMLNGPTTLAARGNRAVVFDGRNQRLMKLELSTPR